MSDERSSGIAVLAASGPVRAMFSRELGRSIRRSRTIRGALSSPDLAPWLELVDAQHLDLCDPERVRLARIIARNAESLLPQEFEPCERWTSRSSTSAA